MPLYFGSSSFHQVRSSKILGKRHLRVNCVEEEGYLAIKSQRWHIKTHSNRTAWAQKDKKSVRDCASFKVRVDWLKAELVAWRVRMTLSVGTQTMNLLVSTSKPNTITTVLCTSLVSWCRIPRQSMKRQYATSSCARHSLVANLEIKTRMKLSR